ncbi:MAG: sulfatase [Phycisphaerae bacterium]
MAAFLSATCALGPPVAGGAKPTRPNIVFLLADDLGWADLGCYGADLHETPHIDRLASEGVRFTQAYAMSVCTPTRAAILTGKHAARLRMTVWRESSLNRQTEAARSPQKLLPPATTSDLPQDETTIAEVLRAAGYLTFHVGKWHLGDVNHAPETNGFDVNIGGTHWGMPATFFWPFRGKTASGEFRYVPGLGLGRPGEYLTDRLTDEALKLIDEAGKRPFFLNLWFYGVHTPIEGKPQLVEHYRRKLKPGLQHQNPDYAAMVHSLDENVGRILEYLETRGLMEHTLIVFASDNGGYVNQFRGRQVTDNAPLRSGKGSLYEGGIRVPLIVRLPGSPARGATCEIPVICMDLFRTFAEVAGAEVETGIDSLSLVPLLQDPGARLHRDALFFHYPHYYPTTTPVSAVRQGNLKLLEYHEDSRVELYDLLDDPGEQKDLASNRPDDVARLRTRLHSWREEIAAQMPSLSPPRGRRLPRRRGSPRRRRPGRRRSIRDCPSFPERREARACGRRRPCPGGR